mmetsp:Transcript_44125/g.114289  ORF Transcript_44125/g.114289 Transcript_44125/m.114289 type:complete len:311 (+) Transcript_44125:1185-2117(+)
MVRLLGAILAAAFVGLLHTHGCQCGVLQLLAQQRALLHGGGAQHRVLGLQPPAQPARHPAAHRRHLAARVRHRHPCPVRHHPLPAPVRAGARARAARRVAVRAAAVRDERGAVRGGAALRCGRPAPAGGAAGPLRLPVPALRARRVLVGAGGAGAQAGAGAGAPDQQPAGAVLADGGAAAGVHRRRDARAAVRKLSPRAHGHRGHVPQPPDRHHRLHLLQRHDARPGRHRHRRLPGPDHAHPQPRRAHRVRRSRQRAGPHEAGAAAAAAALADTDGGLARGVGPRRPERQHEPARGPPAHFPAVLRPPRT